MSSSCSRVDCLIKKSLKMFLSFLYLNSIFSRYSLLEEFHHCLYSSFSRMPGPTAINLSVKKRLGQMLFYLVPVRTHFSYV